MSLVKRSGLKKQGCGNMHHIEREGITDSIGSIIDLQIVGTDPDVGVVIGNNIITDYSPGVDDKNPDGTFHICIETAGVFYVTLADGSDFIVTQVQSENNLGQWLLLKIRSVNVGTTGDFSVGY